MASLLRRFWKGSNYSRLVVGIALGVMVMMLYDLFSKNRIHCVVQPRAEEPVKRIQSSLVELPPYRSRAKQIDEDQSHKTQQTVTVKAKMVEWKEYGLDEEEKASSEINQKIKTMSKIAPAPESKDQKDQDQKDKDQKDQKDQTQKDEDQKDQKDQGQKDKDQKDQKDQGQKDKDQKDQKDQDQKDQDQKDKKTMDWPKHIRETCKKHGVPETRDNFEAGMLGNLVVDEKHKVIFCPIPKVACTTWIRAFLVLNGKLDVSNAFTIPSPQIHKKWGELKYLSQLSKEEVLHRLETYFKFIVVRDPYERFISAYRNKLEPGQGTFHRSFNMPIRRQYRKGKTPNLMPSANPEAASFSEFAEYLADPQRSIKMNNHWIQFHHLCHPCIVEYDYVARMDTMEQDSKYFLDKIGMSNQMSIPSRNRMGYRHQKSQSLVEQYFSSVPKSVIEGLNANYLLDFEVFNLTIPNVQS